MDLDTKIFIIAMCVGLAVLGLASRCAPELAPAPVELDDDDDDPP